MSAFFVRRPIVAIVIAIVTVLGGLVAMGRLPVAQFPDIVPPQILVTATYTGADAVTVEQSVATPLEQQMNGVDDMLYMQSTNANDGTMQLTVTFDIATNPNIDQVNVQNRMAQAQPNLPTDVNQFGLTLRKITGLPMMLVSLSSPNKTYDALFLANYANINIVDALYRVPGVGEVRIFGAGDYAMRIWVKPDRLATMGLTVPDLARAIQQQSTVNPSGQLGAQPGPIGQEMTYTVRAQGRLQTPEEFGSIVLRSNPDGSVVRMKDVARIELGALNYQQIGRVNGQPGVGVAVFQAPGSNALTVAQGVRRAMNDLHAPVPGRSRLHLHARYHTPGVRRHQGHREDARGSPGARHLRRVPLPAELARHAHPDAGRAGVARRHLRRVPAAGFLDQHPVALRPRPRDRPRRRRCDRRGGGGGTSHRRRDEPERRDPESDGGGVRAGHRHRADPRRGLHSGWRDERYSRTAQSAVRHHDCGVGRHLRLQRADAVAGVIGAPAASAQGDGRPGSGGCSPGSTAGSREPRMGTSA